MSAAVGKVPIYLEIPLTIGAGPSDLAIDAARPMRVVSAEYMIKDPEEVIKGYLPAREYVKSQVNKISAIRDSVVTFLKTHVGPDGKELWLGNLWKKNGSKPFSLPSAPIAKIHEDISSLFAKETGFGDSFVSYPLYVSEKTDEKLRRYKQKVEERDELRQTEKKFSRRAVEEDTPDKLSPVKMVNQRKAASRLDVKENVLREFTKLYPIPPDKLTSSSGIGGEAYVMYAGSDGAVAYVKVGYAPGKPPKTKMDAETAYSEVISNGSLVDKAKFAKGVSEAPEKPIVIRRYDYASGKPVGEVIPVGGAGDAGGMLASATAKAESSSATKRILEGETPKPAASAKPAAASAETVAASAETAAAAPKAAASTTREILSGKQPAVSTKPAVSAQAPAPVQPSVPVSPVVETPQALVQPASTAEGILAGSGAAPPGSVPATARLPRPSPAVVAATPASTAEAILAGAGVPLPATPEVPARPVVARRVATVTARPLVTAPTSLPRARALASTSESILSSASAPVGGAAPPGIVITRGGGPSRFVTQAVTAPAAGGTASLLGGVRPSRVIVGAGAPRGALGGYGSSSILVGGRPAAGVTEQLLATPAIGATKSLPSLVINAGAGIPIADVGEVARVGAAPLKSAAASVKSAASTAAKSAAGEQLASKTADLLKGKGGKVALGALAILGALSIMKMLSGRREPEVVVDQYPGDRGIFTEADIAALQRPFERYYESQGEGDELSRRITARIGGL